MKEIAKNEFYELKYDEGRNWIYWTMKGYWKNMQVAPNFDRDWNTALSMVHGSWRVLADLSQLKAMPEDVKSAQDKKQQEMLQRGCERVSCVMASEVTKMSLNQALKQSGMDKIVQYFNKLSEAEKWLYK